MNKDHYMQSKDAPTPFNNWVICLRPNPVARLRLFCFPYAGGGATIYHPWTSSLEECNVEVCSILLPGREQRIAEPAYGRINPLVQKLAVVLRSYQDRPFAFFGHSMGALISFELARQLRNSGEALPIHLFLSGHRAPQLSARDAPIHHLPDSKFMEKMTQLNGIPSEILKSQELIQLVLPTLRADTALCEMYRYTHATRLDCSISAFGGQQDPKVNYQDLAAWKEQTCGFFSIHLLPGDHFYLRSSRLLLMNLLKQHLMRLILQMKSNS
jgi:medium-chain acyl-[acyl-carrier-protein] hydrolase